MNTGIRESLNEKATKDPRFGKIVNILDEVEDVIGKPTFWNKFIHLMDVFEMELESVAELSKIDKDYSSHTVNPFSKYRESKSLISLSDIVIEDVWGWMRKFISEAGKDYVRDQFLHLYESILGTTFSTPISSRGYNSTHAQGLVLMNASKKLNEENSFSLNTLNELFSALDVERCKIHLNISESNITFECKQFSDMKFKWFVKANASRGKDISLNFMEQE